MKNCFYNSKNYTYQSADSGSIIGDFKKESNIEIQNNIIQNNIIQNNKEFIKMSNNLQDNYLMDYQIDNIYKNTNKKDTTEETTQTSY